MYVRTEGSSTLVYTMYLDNLDLFMFSFFIMFKLDNLEVIQNTSKKL